MNRNITGTIRKTDGAVWAGAVIEFELERSSFDDGAQYPVKPVHAKSDESGEISLSLWINEEAPRPSRYICTLPDGSQFRFTLPEGSEAVDLNELRENAIEEDSPSQSDQFALLPLIRSQAQQIVDQSLDAVNAEIDTKADQSALDTTDANVAQIVQDLDTLGHDVEQRASQFDLDTTNTNLAALDAVVATKAAQSALNATDDNLTQLQQEVDELEVEVGKKAYQTSLGMTNMNLLAVTQDLAAANTAIATKANQSALNTTNSNLATTNANLAAANAAIATKAAQSALDTTNTNVTTAFTAIGSRAKQTDLDLTDTKVHTLEQGLDSLIGVVDGKASLDDLNITNGSIDSLWLEVETKARQTALNTTNSNLATTNANLATANTAIATKANQSSLDTTNTNLTAANAAIALRATQFALNVAINDLQTAIADAQDALQSSIDLKADISHTHVSGDVLGDNSSAVAFFDADGVLASSDQLTYFNGKLGLGTNEPEYALDVRQYNSGDGSTGRVVADLNGVAPDLQVIADDIQGELAQLSFVVGSRTHTIAGHADRSLSVGTVGVTTQVGFSLASGETQYRGLLIGDGPSLTDFPNQGDFGFYLTEHGDTLELIFNHLGELRTVDFKGGGLIGGLEA